jgi:hypothetical protein
MSANARFNHRLRQYNRLLRLVSQFQLRRAGPFYHLGSSWHRIMSLTYHDRTHGWFFQALGTELQESYRMLSKIFRGTSLLYRG